MVVTLTNNEKIELKWNFLCIKYLQEYPGGLNKLESDINRGKNRINLSLILVSAIIRSNYPTPITNDDALALVPINEVDNIASFIKREMKNNDFFKKKTTLRKPYPKKR